jgi:hypothetical protein
MPSKYDRYYTFDEAIPYKNIKLYPIKVRDYDLFSKCSQILLLEKNSIPDIKIISMSYLEYVYYLHDQNEGKEQIDFLLILDVLLRLAIGDKDSKLKTWYGRDNKNKPIFRIGEPVFDDKGAEIESKTKWEVFDELDFEEIRTIITQQNLVDIPDETIQKDVRDKMESDRAYKERQSGNKPASFEDTILCLVSATSMSLNEVYELSIRKFIKLLRRVDAKLHYQIYMTAAMSGMVEFKDKSVLRHWMSDLEREDKNDDVLLDYDDFKEKHHMETISQETNS